MTFFNKKEEVIEVKLTPYGKRKLSKGQFNPHSYSFFDDDIIYDSTFGASSGSAHDRIKDTPRGRTQTSFEPATDAGLLEEPLSNLVTETNFAYLLDPPREKIYEDPVKKGLLQPIGTSTPENANRPAWGAYMLLGKMDSSPSHYLSDDRYADIPQMNVTKREFTVKAIRGTDDNSPTYGVEFPDGSSVTLVEGENSEFLLLLQEKNSDSSSENFDIEFYEVDDAGTEEKITPLMFKKGYVYDEIVDGLITDNAKGPDPDLSAYMHDGLVEHYFDVSTDKQIDPDIIAQALAKRRFTDLRDLETFFNSRADSDDETSYLTSGNSSSRLYDLSLEEIASMNREMLEDEERAADSLYDNGDNSDEPC